MAGSFASTDDVETLFRPLSDTEDGQAERLLRMASNLIRQKVANIDVRIAASVAPQAGVVPIDPEIVADVTASMVVRVLRNPQGVKAEGIGPASATYDDRVAAGFLYVSPDELSLLLVRPRPSIGTVRISEGMARHLDRRADPELHIGGFEEGGERGPEGEFGFRELGEGGDT